MDLQEQLEVEKYRCECERGTELYKHQLEWDHLHGRAVIDFALAAIRSLILVNGAAVIALLTFMGNNSGTAAQVGALGMAMRAFSIGVGLGLGAAGTSYLAQLAVVAWRSAEGGETWTTTALRWTAIFFGAGSTAAFIAGAWFGSHAF